MLLIVGTVFYWQLFRKDTPAREASALPSPDTQAESNTPSAYNPSSSTAFTPTATTKAPRPIPHATQTQTVSLKSAPAHRDAPVVNYQGTVFQQKAGNYPYYTAEKKWNPQRKEYEFWRKGMYGSEIPLKIEARRYFLSENQSDYPEPESGCGPTALLNLYIWYSKFGLLKESIRHSNPVTYKRLKFEEIDRKLLNIQRASRTRKGGTNTLAAIVAMDELVQEFTRGPTRLHFEIKQPPLDTRDFIKLSRNYRVGILSVQPKDRGTGRLMGNHAVLCIRGDTAGMISLANWGDFSHGSLVSRPDGQWFVPQDPSQHELRINNLTTLIPFVPRGGS